MKWRRKRQRPWRLFAMLSFRNEMQFLPDYFANISPHVDGIIALDDGSTDGSADFVAAQPNVVRLLSRPAHGDAEWDDAANHRALVEASWDLGPLWLIGLDADERVEWQFRERAERITTQSDVWAYAVRLYELWDGPLQYRSDGIWNHKAVARLFESRREHEFHMQRLHCHWGPLNGRVDGVFTPADLNLYHLRMMTPDRREARRRRYTALDPDRRFQAVGYDYMTDQDGLQISPIPADRHYEPLPR